MVKCRDCEFKEEDYLTSLQGRGIYRFSYCQKLVHDCFVVEPDIERKCGDYEELCNESVPEEGAVLPLDDAESHL